MSDPKKKRVGRVAFDLDYVVDLDNQDMVDNAKTCIYEDICSAIKYNEVFNYIKVTEDKIASESEIPEFLLEAEKDDDDET